MKPQRRNIGLGILVWCFWGGDDHGTHRQSYGFQPPLSIQRPLGQQLYHRHSSRQPFLIRQRPHGTSNSQVAPTRPSLLFATTPSTNNNNDNMNHWDSFHTALCIVPPDDKWDTLQRARHFAGDETYYEWPPAIRLLHPFCESHQLSDVALECAKRVVEKHNLQPFSITLNRWTVLPMSYQLYSTIQQQMTTQNNTFVKPEDDDSFVPMDPEYEQVQALIAQETQKSKARKKERELRRRAKQQQKEWNRRTRFLALANNTQQLLAVEQAILEHQPAPPPTTTTIAAAAQTVTSKPQKEKKKKVTTTSSSSAVTAEPNQYSGHAMIAIEPDEASVRKLQHLRQLLQTELLNSSSTSTSTSTSHLESLEDVVGSHPVSESESFRPMIPVGAFPTFKTAIATARKLKGLWDPLTFTVTDLHFISQQSTSQQNVESEYHNANYFQYDVDPLHHNHRERRQHNNNQNPEGLPIMPSMQKKTMHPTIRESLSPFGLDALVVLMGEELELDPETDEFLANQLLKDGIPGGGDPDAGGGSSKAVVGRDEKASWEDPHSDGSLSGSSERESRHDELERTLDLKGGDWEDLYNWLDEEDEDEDEEIGTSVVIGRTYLFSGEKRKYRGMPASSAAEDLYRAFVQEAIGSEETWADDVDFRLQSGNETG